MLSTSSSAYAFTLFEIYALCEVKFLEVYPSSYDLLIISRWDRYAHSSAVIHTMR